MADATNKAITNPELKRQAIANLVCEQLFVDPTVTLQMVLEQVQSNFDCRELPSASELKIAMEARCTAAMSRFESITK